MEVVDVSVHVDDLPLRTVVEVVIRPLFFGFSPMDHCLFLLSAKHGPESEKTTAMLLGCLSHSVEPRFTRLVMSSS